MTKHIIISIFLLLTGMMLSGAGAQFKPVKTIGDDRDDYTFFAPIGAVISENKDIFVLDGKGVFIAKYDWNGQFIARTGTQGKGPGDFYFPSTIRIFKDKLVVLDRGNQRIAMVDLQLGSFNYIRQESDHKFDSSLFPLDNDRFLGVLNRYQKGADRIGIIDGKGSLVKTFFNKLPIEIDFDGAKNVTSLDKWHHVFRVGKETIPIIGMGPDHKKLLVSYVKPDNPLTFYVYSTEGKLEHTFVYRIKDDKYKLSDFVLKASGEEIDDEKKYPVEEFYPQINSMSIFKNHYVVFLGLMHYQKRELVGQKHYCLIFDKAGTILHEIPLDGPLKIFSLSRRGYAVGSMYEEETTKIRIYQLVL